MRMREQLPMAVAFKYPVMSVREGVRRLLRHSVRPLAASALTALASTLALTATALTLAQPAQARSISYNLDIPSQSLGDALQALALASQHKLLYSSEIVDGKVSVAIKGQYTTDEAVKQLLSATDLAYEVTGDGLVIIEPKGGQKIQGDGSKISYRGSENNLRVSEVSGPTDGAGEKRGFWTRLAQTDPTSDSEGSAGTSERVKIEEIVVTAQKREERLQDVPISIDVITSDDLRKSGAADIKDLFGSIPGLASSNTERNLSRYNIRGVSSNTGAPTVGIYLDDISLVTGGEGVFVGALDSVMFDLDRIEVLKGPQGTLYGDSAMGGAIKYVSARPNLSAASLNIAAGGGSTEHGAPSYNAEAIGNIPLISGTLALRVGASFRHEGGYIDNVAGGELENLGRSSTPAPVYTPLVQPSLSTRNQDDYNSTDTWIAKASLLWQPDESWSIRPTILFQDYKIDNISTYFPNQGSKGGLTSSYRIPQSTHDRSTIYSLDIDKTFRGMRLTSLTAQYDRDAQWNRDFSYLVGNIVPPLYPFTSEARYPTNIKTFSQELRLASEKDSGSRLQWLGGLYYSSQESHFAPIAYVYDAVPVMTALGFPPSLFIDGVVSENVASSDARGQTDQLAAFGEVTYSLTSALDMTAGVRVFEIRSKADLVVDGPFNGGHRESYSIVTEDGVSPKFGLSYKFNPNHMAYASGAKGFRPGGASGAQRAALTTLCANDLARLGITDLPLGYESDDLWTYELGSKHKFGGGRVAMNGAVFHSDWRKIQQFVFLQGCGQGFVVNAGEARVDGAEIGTEIQLTSALQLGVNGIYTRAKIVESAFGTIIQEGDQIQDAPKWMGGAFASYERPLNQTWTMQLRADYSYRSEQRRDYVRTQGVIFSDGVPGAVPYTQQFREAYDWANAYVSFSNESMDVRVFANNLFDSRPVLDAGVTSGVSTFWTLRPRTIGIEIRQRF